MGEEGVTVVLKPAAVFLYIYHTEDWRCVCGITIDAERTQNAVYIVRCLWA
jgi:hypothetical protein